MSSLKQGFIRFEWWITTIEPGWLAVVVMVSLVLLISIGAALVVGFIFRLPPFV